MIAALKLNYTLDLIENWMKIGTETPQCQFIHTEVLHSHLLPPLFFPSLSPPLTLLPFLFFSHNSMSQTHTHKLLAK